MKISNGRLTLHRFRIGLPGLGVLAGSSFMAELMNAALLPYIAWKYPEESIAEFVLATAIGSILAVGSSLRLEHAIPFADADDRNELALITLGLSGAIAVLFALASTPFVEWLVLAAIISLSISSASIASFVLLGENRSQLLAGSRFAGASIRTFLIVAFPLLGLTSSLALVIGTSVGTGATAVLGLRHVHVSRIRQSQVSVAVRKYRSFPLVQLPTALINAASMEMGLLALGFAGAPRASVASAGLAQRAVMRPGGVVVGATSDAFLGNVSATIGNKSAPSQFETMLKKLAVVGVFVAAAGGLGSYFVLPMIIGSGFADVGEFALPMCFVIGVRIVANPAQQLLVGFGWHAANLTLSISRLVAVIVAPIVTFQLFDSALLAFYAYCAASFTTYGALVVFVRRKLRKIQEFTAQSRRLSADGNFVSVKPEQRVTTGGKVRDEGNVS